MKSTVVKFFIVASIFIIPLMLWYCGSVYKKMMFKNNLINSIESIRRQTPLGKDVDVVIENKLKADLCIVCPPYTDSEELEKKLDAKITKKTAEKICKRIYFGEENWILVLIKDRNIVFDCFLPYVQVKNLESDNMLIKQIKNEKFSLKFLKIDKPRNLVLTQID